MRTECTGQTELFSIGKRRVTLVPDGNLTSSDAGVLLLASIERRLRLAERLASMLRDRRDPMRVVHTYEDQLRQRMLQIACGYEDADDADALRGDAAFQTAMRRVAGTENALLASQPTLSRFEQRDAGELLRMSEVLVDLWIDDLLAQGPKAWRRIVLEFDSTDDPTHGAQQLSMFHGYYDQYMYHPLLVFDGRGWPVAVVLRPGKAHASSGAVAILLRIFKRIVERLPRSARILFRADAGFAMPEIYEMCETLGIDYVIGQITNESYKGRTKGALRQARRQFTATGETARVYSSFSYRARSWPRRRRIVAKLEVMAQGENPRFVVTNLPGTPDEVYATYTARGQAENFIKDLKNAMFADRLSCSAFHANQFRLLMHTAAYILMFVLRRTMAGTELERAQMSTLRLKLLKIGATIKVTARRVWVHLSEHHPSLPGFFHVATGLAAASP